MQLCGLLTTTYLGHNQATEGSGQRYSLPFQRKNEEGRKEFKVPTKPDEIFWGFLRGQFRVIVSAYRIEETGIHNNFLQQSLTLYKYGHQFGEQYMLLYLHRRSRAFIGPAIKPPPQSHCMSNIKPQIRRNTVQTHFLPLCRITCCFLQVVFEYIDPSDERHLRTQNPEKTRTERQREHGNLTRLARVDLQNDFRTD